MTKVSPATALLVGLKADVDALPPAVINALKELQQLDSHRWITTAAPPICLRSSITTIGSSL
jgi:hypothetical protein